MKNNCVYTSDAIPKSCAPFHMHGIEYSAFAYLHKAKKPTRPYYDYYTSFFSSAPCFNSSAD